MEPNTNTAERKFSAFECIYGFFRYMLRNIAEYLHFGLVGEIAPCWHMIFTRMDKYMANCSNEHIRAYAITIYVMWTLLVESLLGCILLNWVGSIQTGVIWMLVFILVRFSQYLFYLTPETCQIYTLPGAIYNTREILADNWAWVRKVGEDELKRRNS